jgi:F0F1-type ATP synthase membrane subunit b/b'
MPHLDAGFFAGQLFWLTIFFLATYFFLKKAFLPHVRLVVTARENQIKKDLAAAEKALKELEHLQKKIDTILTSAREEAGNMRLQAVQQAKTHTLEQMAKIEDELAEKFTKYEAELLRTREKVLFELKNQYDSLETDVMKVLNLSMQFPTSSLSNIIKN